MKEKSRIVIFKNQLVGQPIKRKDGSVVEYNGKPMLNCDLNGKITLPEGLEAGEYEVSIYRQQSKRGLTFYSGNIKPAFVAKNKARDEHDKAIDKAMDDLDDSCPF